MNVKIDTKEKFTVITLNEPDISANMTEELSRLLLGYLNNRNPHIIINLKNVVTMNVGVAEQMLSIQKKFNEKNSSFIICEVQKEVVTLLNKNNMFEEMNITRTESEAWDILQMEEIERELFDNIDE